jgi:hypothetical protein
MFCLFSSFCFVLWFFEPHCTTYHSNVGVRLSEVAKLVISILNKVNAWYQHIISRIIPIKLDTPNLNCHRKQPLIFEWCVVICKSKNKQKMYLCSIEIGVCVQNVLETIIDFVYNIIVGTYVIISWDIYTTSKFMKKLAMCPTWIC